MHHQHLTKNQERLLRLFQNIDDNNVKEIIIETINIEVTIYAGHNFPIREVRNKIDSVARLQEMNRDTKVDQ